MDIKKALETEMEKVKENIKRDLEGVQIPYIKITVFGEVHLYMLIVCENEQHAAQWKPVLEKNCDRVDVYYSEDDFGDDVVKVLGSAYVY